MDRLGAGLEGTRGEVGAADVARDEALVVRVGFFPLAVDADVVVREEDEAVGLVVLALFLLVPTNAISLSFLLLFALTGDRSSLI